jgi:hypothetical protein
VAVSLTSWKRSEHPPFPLYRRRYDTRLIGRSRRKRGTDRKRGRGRNRASEGILENRRSVPRARPGTSPPARSVEAHGRRLDKTHFPSDPADSSGDRPPASDEAADVPVIWIPHTFFDLPFQDARRGELGRWLEFLLSGRKPSERYQT